MLIYAYPMSILPQPESLVGPPLGLGPSHHVSGCFLWSSGVLNQAFWQGLHSELVMGLFDHSKAQQLTTAELLSFWRFFVVLKVLLAWTYLNSCHLKKFSMCTASLWHWSLIDHWSSSLSLCHGRTGVAHSLPVIRFPVGCPSSNSAVMASRQRMT